MALINPTRWLIKISLACAILLLAVSAQSCMAAEKADQSIRQLLDKIYSQYQPWKNKQIDLDNAENLRAFFDEELAGLFEKDSTCMKTKQEICNLDFDPFYYAQDFTGSSRFSVKKVSADAANAKYQVTLGKMAITYLFKPTQHGWRIIDIIYPDKNSLKKLLSEPTD